MPMTQEQLSKFIAEQNKHARIEEEMQKVFGVNYAKKTNAQLAAANGISKRQVSKLKKQIRNEG